MSPMTCGGWGWGPGSWRRRPGKVVIGVIAASGLILFSAGCSGGLPQVAAGTTTSPTDTPTPAAPVTTPADDATTPADDFTTPADDTTTPVDIFTTPSGASTEDWSSSDSGSSSGSGSSSSGSGTVDCSSLPGDGSFDNPFDLGEIDAKVVAEGCDPLTSGEGYSTDYFSFTLPETPGGRAYAGAAYQLTAEEISDVHPAIVQGALTRLRGGVQTSTGWYVYIWSLDAGTYLLREEKLDSPLRSVSTPSFSVVIDPGY